MHCSLCLFFISLLDKVFSGCFRQAFFHLGEKKVVAGRVRQVVVLYGYDFSPSESRIAFCRLFIVRVKKVCYERKLRGELLGSSFHCTMEWLCPYVPTTSFRLMALRNWVECQCYNETNIPPS